MENQFSKVTKSKEYTNTCIEDYSEYYQLHILSYSQVFSNYYKKTEYSLDTVKTNTLNIFESIKNKTSFPIEAGFFEKDGIFLISDSDELINYTDLFDFDIEQGCYDFNNLGINLFDFIGETPADVYFKNALTTVGAASLIPVVEPFLPELLEEQTQVFEMYKQMREEDKASPLFLVEIYKIEKNYIPNKTHEFKCASLESATTLPEIRNLVMDDERATLLIKDLETHEIIEGSLEEAIEGIKHAKWVKKHPSVIDPALLVRMKLDSTHPDYLSYDDYIAELVEFEEGDDEYEPNFRQSGSIPASALSSPI
jgi:hypothetical protein